MHEQGNFRGYFEEILGTWHKFSDKSNLNFVKILQKIFGKNTQKNLKYTLKKWKKFQKIMKNFAKMNKKIRNYV